MFGELIFGILLYIYDCIFYFSYCETNIRARNDVRKYNAYVPEYLINRPPDMQRHSMDKLNKADKMNLSFVNSTLSPTIFTVLSYESNHKGELYEVSFGDDDKLPSCSCPSWPFSPYLCKHFFVVMRKYPHIKWDTLSKLYRDSPLFKLDYFDESEARECPRNHGSDQVMTVTHSAESVDEYESVLESLPASAISPPTAPSTTPPLTGVSFVKCRELLGQIRDLTYRSKDASAAEDFYQLLVAAKEKLVATIPTENGLMLGPQPNNAAWSRKAPNRPPSSTSDATSIPIPAPHPISISTAQPASLLVPPDNSDARLAPLPLRKGAKKKSTETVKEAHGVKVPKKTKMDIPEVVEEAVVMDLNTITNEHCFTDNKVNTYVS